MADEIGAVTESHHFYPALFYFRFPEPHYSVSRFTLVSLDAVSLIRSGLDDDESGWLKQSAAVTEIWRTSMLLLGTLTKHFLSEHLSEASAAPDHSKA